MPTYRLNFSLVPPSEDYNESDTPVITKREAEKISGSELIKEFLVSLREMTWLTRENLSTMSVQSAYAEKPYKRG